LALCALAAVLLVGSGPASARSRGGEAGESGVLVVRVVALPPSLAAAVSVRGLGGFRRQLRASATLKQLRPGSYTLRVATRRVGEVSEHPVRLVSRIPQPPTRPLTREAS
jgi:hypothetical protein